MPAKATQETPKSEAATPVIGITPDQLNDFLGQLQQLSNPQQLADAARAAQVGDDDNPALAQLAQLLGPMAAMTQSQADRERKEQEAQERKYPFFYQANAMMPQYIGGGKEGMKALLKDSTANQQVMDHVSEGVSYLRQRRLCPSAKAVNWVLETDVLGDILIILAAFGIIGGGFYLAKEVIIPALR